MTKIRLDQLLVHRGLVETRAKAQALLMAGLVEVEGQTQTKPGTMVKETSHISITQPLPYVSRGGYKLAHALNTFGLSPNGLIALDVGASTGGFTDVLLQHGAAHVYAVDVGYGLLDWRLRQDHRITLIERTNIRFLETLPNIDLSDAEEAFSPNLTPNRQGASKRTDFPFPLRKREHEGISIVDLPLKTPPLAHCCTIDVSFISLKLVLPAVQRLLSPHAWIVALIKPQFEAGPQHVGKGGVVRDPAVHRNVLHDILHTASNLGQTPCGLTRSPITGPAGNIEFLAWLQPGGTALHIEKEISHW